MGRSARSPQPQPARDWSDYVMGVARELVLAGYPGPALEPAHLEHRAGRLRTELFRRHRGVGSAGPARGPSHGADRTGQALPPRGEQFRRDAVRHHGPVHLRLRPGDGGREDRLPQPGARDRALCRSEAEFVAVNTMVKHELGSSAYRAKGCRVRRRGGGHPGEDPAGREPARRFERDALRVSRPS